MTDRARDRLLDGRPVARRGWRITLYPVRGGWEVCRAHKGGRLTCVRVATQEAALAVAAQWWADPSSA
ncbi:MAG: hypothetical protein K6V97_04050 [Actinomycetia bacterium]|nr:hypothetical protein [Actinomycetes bacterium]